MDFKEILFSVIVSLVLMVFVNRVHVLRRLILG